MWTDVETGRDFLNFSVLAKLVSQMIVDARGQALSIGISGGWGVGKSSMVKLIEADLKQKMEQSNNTGETDDPSLLFVSFNAWLYQGQDDAKAAFMEEVASALAARAKKMETSVDKGMSLLKRIDGFRSLRLAGELALTAYTGLPVGAIARAGKRVYDNFTDGDISGEDWADVADTVKEQGGAAKGFIKQVTRPTPPQMIQAIRDDFEKLLDELNVTLVVFVDDLDRCLPPTVIGTLEAMRLFFFMKRTAFIIAADDKMIKEAVRVQFPGTTVDDDVITSYFDKLIQVPLRVPPLGTNEAKAYLMMLFVENSKLAEGIKEDVRLKVNERLAESWQGTAVDAEFVQGLVPSCPDTLKAELELADRLARQLIKSPKVNGNPRLIKRFMNTLSIRKSLAKVQKITVDDAIFAKLMLFERFASTTSFASLTELISTSADGKSPVLRDLEADVRSGAEIKEERWPSGWKDDLKNIEDWLKLQPEFGGIDLRGALHVGRESAPIIAAEHKLSKNAAALMAQLATLKIAAPTHVKQMFVPVAPEERAVIMTGLLDKASSETEWGTPNILFGLEAMAEVDTVQAERLGVFLKDRPTASLRASIIPRLQQKPWGKTVLISWATRSDVVDPMKRGLAAVMKAGK